MISRWSHELGHRISVKLGEKHFVWRGKPRVKRLWFATCTCHPRWIGEGKTRDAALEELRCAVIREAPGSDV